jgi:hypothetical protein
MELQRLQPVRQGLAVLLAFFVLNAALSMTNWWPTPFVKLDARVAPEFVLLWTGLLAAAWVHAKRFGAGTPAAAGRGITVITALYMLLVLGRYFDTTAPALFARSLTLYWDIPQIPRVVFVTLRSYPWWVAVLVVGGVLALLVAVWWVLRWGIGVLATRAAPAAARNPLAWLVTALALVAALANFNGVQATWPYMSKPATPTYWHQAALLWATFNERELHKNLPPSPPFTSDLALLSGSDVNLVFWESYGQIAFGIPEVNDALLPARAQLAAQIKASGMEVVSGFFGSTTYGGRSELAHVAFLSGLDTANPWVHDLLVTTDRPLLTAHFAQRGYEVHALYPALSWDWPEAKFYRFNTFMDSRDLSWPGPKLGYWSVPDQYSVAKYHQLKPITAQSPPRLFFFPSITSHIPFTPVPPYFENWADILRKQPLSTQQIAQVDAQREQWLNMRPAYTAMMGYNHDWLRGWLAQPRVRDAVFIVMGDHQPAANVTGEGASWDVPVHIISSKPELLARFKRRGFASGLQPPAQPLGKLFDLTRMVLEASHSQDQR